MHDAARLNRSFPLAARLLWIPAVLVLLLLAGMACGPTAGPTPVADNGATPPPPPPPLAPADPVTLSVVHYNDFHATFEPRKEDGMPAGGIATLVSAVRAARELATTEQRRQLVMDAGDFFTGQVLHTLTRGAASIEFQNRVAPDVAVPGNHEFDMGDEHFVKLLTGKAGSAASTIPWVCANVQVPGAPWTPWKVFDLNGLKVGVIGINTPTLASSVLRTAIGSTTVEPVAPAVERALKQLQGKAELIVVLSHCGVDVDKEWLPAFAGRVHLVVAGHSHDTLEHGEECAGVPIVSAGAFGRWLGRIDLTWDRANHRLMKWSANLQSLQHDEAPAPPDEATAALLEQKLEKLKPELDRQIATAKSSLSQIARPESPLAVWEAGAFRAAVPGADLGLINPYGVRKSLSKGAVTVNDLLECNPFRNTLVKIVLSGEEILRATSLNLMDRPLQWDAGARIEYNPMLPADRRVVAMTIGGTAVDPARNYVVVTNNYVVSQPEKYFHITRDLPGDDTGLIDADVLIAAAEAAGELDRLPEAQQVYKLVAVPPGADLSTAKDAYVMGEFNVVAVFDGDTIRVGGLSTRIRFLGIDTEETFKPGNGHSEQELRDWAARDFADYAKAMRGDSIKPVKFDTPMGEAAKAFCEKRLEGKRVRLEFDDPARMKDVYDRWLMYVFYQPEGAPKDAPWVNLALEEVREGLAPYYVKYGHLARFHTEFAQAEAEARAAKRGIWSAQPTDGVPDHYPDYAERWPWWQRVGTALEAYKAARKADPDGVPLMIEDGADADKLPDLVGQRVEAFVRVREGGVSGQRVTCGFNANQSFSISFATAELMSQLWKTEYEGELLLVKGTLQKAGSKGWTILPEKPGDLDYYQK